MHDLTQKENPLLYWFSKIGDFFVLSIVWLLLCLPVLTFVPASIALYDSIAHCIRGNEESPLGRFFRTLKSELLRGLLLSAMWLVIGFLLAWGYNILYQLGKEDAAMGAYSLVYLCTMVVPLGVLAWMIPVESRFQHSFFGLLRSSAVYAIAHLPTTVVLVVLFLVTAFLCGFFPILALLLPAITVTIQSWFVERVFKKYIPQEEENHDDEQ